MSCLANNITLLLRYANAKLLLIENPTSLYSVGRISLKIQSPLKIEGSHLFRFRHTTWKDKKIYHIVILILHYSYNGALYHKHCIGILRGETCNKSATWSITSCIVFPKYVPLGYQWLIVCYNSRFHPRMVIFLKFRKANHMPDECYFVWEG